MVPLGGSNTFFGDFKKYNVYLKEEKLLNLVRIEWTKNVPVLSYGLGDYSFWIKGN
jgi:hypothetical protein